MARARWRIDTLRMADNNFDQHGSSRRRIDTLIHCKRVLVSSASVHAMSALASMCWVFVHGAGGVGHIVVVIGVGGIGVCTNAGTNGGGTTESYLDPYPGPAWVTSTHANP
ncbi:uncharacterized protein F5147DRAFT_652570 [Suillus discolor]|uniref:Uncharacterized protein n=1 Tax=Suillus discolor TaxID=1912936 RepID=A0A9P7F8J0_9AGAM|nr:uncharacterized protein F5147DRAFT_652570 [Suillus discolor]KAG2108992.1 hypothetical protein F5147DRAFT_652570 [Suillus discolor]